MASSCQRPPPYRALPWGESEAGGAHLSITLLCRPKDILRIGRGGRREGRLG